MEEPFWQSGRGVLKRYTYPSGSVDFEAERVEPSSFRLCPKVKAKQDRDGLPLLIFLAGLGESGGFKALKLDDLAAVAHAPFVIATPCRDNDKWWFIDHAGEWGWVDGEFCEKEVDKIAKWINDLAHSPGIDSKRVSLLGFSAGAYAATELLACYQLNIYSCIVGGVHGHGQPDSQGIQGAKRLRNIEKIKDKWEKYLARLDRSDGFRGHGVFVHRTDDTMSPWSYAQEIIHAINRRQKQLDLPEAVHRDVPLDRNKAKDRHTSHNYMMNTFGDESILNCALYFDLDPAAASLQQANFDGVWSTGKYRVTVAGTVLAWENGERDTMKMISPTKFTWRTADGDEFTAVLEPDGKLYWNDGDIWTREGDDWDAKERCRRGRSRSNYRSDPGVPEQDERRCPGNCGFQVTWHESHCCKMCLAEPGQHGKKCDRKPVTERPIIPKEIFNAQMSMIQPAGSRGAHSGVKAATTSDPEIKKLQERYDALPKQKDKRNSDKGSCERDGDKNETRCQSQWSPEGKRRDEDLRNREKPPGKNEREHSRSRSQRRPPEGRRKEQDGRNNQSSPCRKGRSRSRSRSRRHSQSRRKDQDKRSNEKSPVRKERERSNHHGRPPARRSLSHSVESVSRSSSSSSKASSIKRSPRRSPRRSGQVETMLNRVVAISCRTGWFVDSVSFHTSDGQVHRCPDNKNDVGGDSETKHPLSSGEHIVSVEQKNHHVGYLGSKLTFQLSSGRTIVVEGTAGRKKNRSCDMMEAHPDTYVHGLRFDGSKLVELLCSPL